MKCPACHAVRLSSVDLADGLKALACDHCGGHWISNHNYQDWFAGKNGILPEKPFSEIDIEVDDSQAAKLCPGCGKILLKYKVGHGLDFFVEHCAGCGGVWLDKNEWKALEARNLHDEIHRVFSTAWQKQIREENMAATLEAAHRKRFGDETYEKARDIREWLQAHPQKGELLSFLGEA